MAGPEHPEIGASRRRGFGVAPAQLAVDMPCRVRPGELRHLRHVRAPGKEALPAQRAVFVILFARTDPIEGQVDRIAGGRVIGKLDGIHVVPGLDVEVAQISGTKVTQQCREGAGHGQPEPKGRAIHGPALDGRLEAF